MKEFKIELLPEDFINTAYGSNEDCALSRAMRRHFDEEFCTCGANKANIWEEREYHGHKRAFEIKGLFSWEDHQRIENNFLSGEVDIKHFVTLIEFV